MNFPSNDLCIKLPAIPRLEDICFPGGFCLSYIWSGVGQIPTDLDMVMDFMGQLGPAMAPLVPFFNILDTVVQIFKCIQAVPEVITNPKKLIDCIPALAALVDKLLSLVPQIAIPKLIKSILLAVAMMLGGVGSELRMIQYEMERIARAIDRAAQLGDVDMNGFLVCAQGDLNDTVNALALALKGIGRIILLVNIFIGLIGGQEIPCLGSLLENNLSKGFDAVIEILLTMADILRQLAMSIVDPDAALTLAMGSKSC